MPCGHSHSGTLLCSINLRLHIFQPPETENRFIAHTLVQDANTMPKKRRSQGSARVFHIQKNINLSRRSVAILAPIPLPTKWGQPSYSCISHCRRNRFLCRSKLTLEAHLWRFVFYTWCIFASFVPSHIRTGGLTHSSMLFLWIK